MKTTKRILALLMAMTLVFALGATAFATGITIGEPTGASTDNTYDAFKILDATSDGDLIAYTLNETYAQILINVIVSLTEENPFPDYEDVPNYENVKGDVNALNKLTADIVDYIPELDMRDFAVAMYDAIVTAGCSADATLSSNTRADVNKGYWLIAETTASGNKEDGETKSLVMIDTTAGQDIEIISKKDILVPEKTVDGAIICGYKEGDSQKDDNGEIIYENDVPVPHHHSDACYGYGKANQDVIGSTQKFDIKADIPSNAAGYTGNYFFIIGDTLSKGLTLNEESITVKIGGTAAAADTDYTISYDHGNYTFAVALIDAKAHAGETVEINYTALLNGDAVVGNPGNSNTAKVEFSNDPQSTYEGFDTDTGFPKEGSTDVLGASPESKTLTFTTGIEIIKTDGKTKKALTGAAFTITSEGLINSSTLKWEQKYVFVKQDEETEEYEDGTYYELKDGTYTSVAPVLEEMIEYNGVSYEGGYVKCAEGEAADKTIAGVDYRISTDKDFGKNTIYRLQLSNLDKYSDKNRTGEDGNLIPSFNLVEGFAVADAATKFENTFAVDENGLAFVAGLPAGTYHVTESTVPQGYNKVDDFDIVVKIVPPTEVTDGNETADISVEVNGAGLNPATIDGTDWTLFELNIENFSGTELPSTGGIGTTIFYLVGGCMLLFAGVLLITKRRMSREQ